MNIYKYLTSFMGIFMPKDYFKYEIHLKMYYMKADFMHSTVK